MKPHLVGIEAARATLKDLCAAAARGEEVVITRRGRPIARVVGVQERHEPLGRDLCARAEEVQPMTDLREFLAVAGSDDHTAARAAWQSLTPDDRALVDRFLSRSLVFNAYGGEEAEAGRRQFRAMMLDLGKRRASAQETSEAIKKFQDDLAATRAARVEASPDARVAARLQRLEEALMLRAYIRYATMGMMDEPQPVARRQELAFALSWLPGDIRKALAWFTVAAVRRWGRSSLPDPAVPGSTAFTVAEDLFGFSSPLEAMEPGTDEGADEG